MKDERREDLATDDVEEREGFLTRWSHRKVLARQGVDLPEPEPAGIAGAEPGADGGPEVVEDETELAGDPVAAQDTAPELPPIESLDEDSDYSPFLATGVSPDMQREALRKLFRSPKFNVRDGLDDYDLDFTNPEPLGNIVTAEMRRRMQIELERLAGLDEDDEGAGEAIAAADAGHSDQTPNPVDTVDTVDTDDAGDCDGDHDGDDDEHSRTT